MALWNCLSFFNLLLSHLIFPLSFYLLSPSSISWLRSIMSNLLLVLDEQEVILKGVSPVAPISLLPTSTLSTWGTWVDSDARRVKLLSAIEGELNTYDDYWGPLLKYLLAAWWLPFLISMQEGGLHGIEISRNPVHSKMGANISPLGYTTT